MTNHRVTLSQVARGAKGVLLIETYNDRHILNTTRIKRRHPATARATESPRLSSDLNPQQHSTAPPSSFTRSLPQAAIKIIYQFTLALFNLLVHCSVLHQSIYLPLHTHTRGQTQTNSYSSLTINLFKADLFFMCMCVISVC